MYKSAVTVICCLRSLPSASSMEMYRPRSRITWPVLCTVYVGRGLNSATGTVDATGFDLSIMREAGDRFLKLPDIRPDPGESDGHPGRHAQEGAFGLLPDL